MSSSVTLDIHVVAWPGQEESAARILGELRDSGVHATVIYALSGAGEAIVASDWVVVDGFGYGAVFEESLHISDSDVLLHVHADCSTESWSEITQRCQSIFASSESVGVWSPIVDWSSWNLARTRLGGGIVPSTHAVTTVDGIVWALASPVIERLRTLDFSDNPKGWGIDLSACAIAHSLGLAVLMDEAVFVKHPRGSGYNHGDAGRESEAFAKQLRPAEFALYRRSQAIARERIRREKSSLSYRLGTALKSLKLRILDPVYRAFFR